MSRSFRLVVNSNAGQGQAPQLAEEARRRIAAAGCREVASGGDSVIVFGGDGTVHDYLNDAASFDPQASLVIVPCGTANALYAAHHSDQDIWRSLMPALEDDKDHLKPLSLALVDRQKIACVVVSVALHASILYDSEALRKTHPGIERFKLAAQQNFNRSYPGSLKLEGDVRRYSPSQGGFVQEDSSQVELDGPFSYALLGALTDRLEPTFVVAPLRHADTSPGLDVVVIRRPASYDGFAEKVLMPVTAAMYDRGKHIDLVYGPDVRPFAPGDDSRAPVVDYFRCTRARWTPGEEAGDIRTRLLCIDGVVQEIAPGQSVTVATHSPSPSVWL